MLTDCIPEKYFKKLLQEKEVEDALQRLDKILEKEDRVRGTEILRVVHVLLRNWEHVMDNGKWARCREKCTILIVACPESQAFKLAQDIRSALGTSLYQDIQVYI